MLLKKNESSTKSKYEENQEKKENPTKLTSDEKAEVFKLKAIDSKIKAHGITISMNGAGRSVDNICIERFWRSVYSINS